MFCAICTDDIADGVQRPLGRGGALVTICKPCDEDGPESGRYSFGGGRETTKTGITGSHIFASRTTRKAGT